MKIQVLDDRGRVMLDFDPQNEARTMIDAARVEKMKISEALSAAEKLVSSDRKIIASISEDILTAAGRIETELGAHPAFTWAQTKLGNAIAHLDAYMKGIWTEPPSEGLNPVDQRGIQIPPASDPSAPFAR